MKRTKESERERMRIRRTNPEVRERERQYAKARRARPEVQAHQQVYEAARRADPARKQWKVRYNQAYFTDPVVAAHMRDYYRAHRAEYNARTQARRAAQKQRLPAWADLSAIAGLYQIAQNLTGITGVRHEVDHYYPLQGKAVSGLHVDCNLRVVPRRLNRAKINKHPDELV